MSHAPHKLIALSEMEKSTVNSFVHEWSINFLWWYSDENLITAPVVSPTGSKLGNRGIREVSECGGNSKSRKFCGINLHPITLANSYTRLTAGGKELRETGFVLRAYLPFAVKLSSFEQVHSLLLLFLKRTCAVLSTCLLDILALVCLDVLWY